MLGLGHLDGGHAAWIRPGGEEEGRGGRGTGGESKGYPMEHSIIERDVLFYYLKESCHDMQMYTDR